MSRTPIFDVKIQKILEELPAGKEAEICRRFQVPPPSMPPDRLLDYLNGFNSGLAFFWKPHMRTGKPIFSAIHPDNPLPVITEEEWAAEDYDLAEREVETGRSVMEQLWDLAISIPSNPTRSVDCVNSVTIGSIKTRDCYVVIGGMSSRCYYGYGIFQAEDCIDLANCLHAARSFQCGGSNDIADSQGVFESRACLHSSFLFDCWNCEDCFGATNQRNKRYIFFNQPLSKEEYQKKVTGIDLSDRRVFEKYYQDFLDLWRREGVWPEAIGYGNTEADGEHLFGCVRCEECYWQEKSVDCFRCRFGIENQRCVYTSGQGWTEDCYMTTGGTYGAQNKFCIACAACLDCEYCFNCKDSEYCFGCVGLQRKRFYIFNKAYSEEDYWPLVDALKSRMLGEGSYGSFFPAKFSPVGFQYSVGALYVGYPEKDLQAFGAPIFDLRRGQQLTSLVLNKLPVEAKEIPDRLDDMDPAIFVGTPIHDADLDRIYTIRPEEFRLYQEKHWPAPHVHFVTRLTSLIQHSNSPIREEKTCGACRKPIITYKNFTFTERRVYCRPCYAAYLEKRG